MTVLEIKQLIGDTTLPFLVRQSSMYKKRLYINDKTAIKVDNVSSYFDSIRDITLKNKEGDDIGVLTFTKDNPNILDSSTNKILLSALNPDQVIAFLTESDNGLSYPTFTSNYVILKRKYVDEYFKRYYASAPLWGSFSHPSSGISLNTSYKKVVNEIVGIPNLKIPRAYYYPNCVRAIQQPFAFERFLKFYHLLELSFDSFVVEKIKKLNLNTDSNKIGKLLNEYDQKEIKRLSYLLKEKCKNPHRFIDILNTINNFETTALTLLYTFGNDDNPIKKETSYITISRSSYFGDANNLRVHGISINADRNLEVFLIQVVSYIIYRVRCSVAHNKIGEFIFQHTPADEKFIVEFAEPLLKEVLIQCFK
jgi:hypothetical protein